MTLVIQKKKEIFNVLLNRRLTRFIHLSNDENVVSCFSKKLDQIMDIFQYRKAFVYALTFLAYAWSGYGAGLLSNLRDAVLTAETIFSDFFENAITVARKIRDVHEVFDAAVEENCEFHCPTGKLDKNNLAFVLLLFMILIFLLIINVIHNLINHQVDC